MAGILLVGHDRERAGELRPLLRRDGHEVTWLRSVDAWGEAEKDERPELIVAALESPEPVLSARGAPSRVFPAPILLVQHEGDLVRDPTLEDRLVDSLRSPFMAEDFLARVDALVRVRRVVRRERPQESERGALRGFGRGFRRLLAGAAADEAKPVGPYLEVAARVAEWADRRDMFEPGHAERVASFCALMADGLALPDREVEVLLRAAMLHDIGKITLPVEILRQRGPLNDDIMRLVRTHAERGAALLRALDPDDEIARVVLYHHERPDGTGYFRKDALTIPRASRVLAVAEAFDAMTASRWGEPVTAPAAVGLLKERRGDRYDSDSVDALVDALEPRPHCIPLRSSRAGA